MNQDSLTNSTFLNFKESNYNGYKICSFIIVTFFRNQSHIKVSFIQINDEDEHIHDAKLKKKKNSRVIYNKILS